MKNLLHIILIMSHISIIFGSFWVPWPKGIFWWVWRMSLKMNVQYDGFYVFYFYEWRNNIRNNLWANSEYEEPRYFKTVSSFVPSYLRRHCDEDGIDARSLQYYAAREDINKDYIILRSLGGSKYYDNLYWQIYIMFLYNVCNCMFGNSISYTCPDPCRKPDMCVYERYVVKGSCQKIYDKRVFDKLKDGDFKNIFGKLYRSRAQCACLKGFRWNRKSMKCVLMRSGCDLNRVGDRVCQHGGKCIPVPADEREYDFLVLSCVCAPAWKGYLCTEPVNPCLYSKRLCGSFICRRDATSISRGYYCVCTKGFRRHSQAEPRCINIDECQEMPCQHGSKCLDLTPDPLNAESILYNCTCIRGFTGQNCEIPPKRPQWSDWGQWSTCSLSCGIGVISRFRLCSVSGRCSGLSNQSTACILLGLSCDFIGEAKQEEDLKMKGIGWTAESERVLDDAFRWNEELYSNNPKDTLLYLNYLEYAISAILSVILIPLAILCLFNIIMVGPYQWFLITMQSHAVRQGWVRGGKIGHERKKKGRKHKKTMRKGATRRIRWFHKWKKGPLNDEPDNLDRSGEEDDHSSMSGASMADSEMSEISEISEFKEEKK